MHQLNRRQLVQSFGLGGAAYFLPTLRDAHAATPPQRVIIFYTHQGTLPWLWRPTGSRTDFQLGWLHEALAPYKQDLSILDGVDFKGLELPNGKGGQDGHATTQSTSMTANVQINHTRNDAQSRGKGPSFDWWLARELEAKNGGKSPTPFPEQRFRIYERMPDNPNWGRPYEDDKDQWLLPAIDPTVSYMNLFGGAMMGGTPSGADNAAILRKKSVLDFAAKEFDAVGNKVGAFERQRLTQHADLVRDLEKNLVLRGEAAAACTPPEKPTGQRMAAGNWNRTSAGFIDITRAALMCDLTRVVVLHVDEVSPALYGGINAASLGGINNLHDLVHALNVDKREAQDKARLDVSKAYYRQLTAHFKILLDKLAEPRESDGKRLLDHTTILWCGEIAQPGHSPHNNKWLMAGSAGGKIKNNLYLNNDGEGVVWAGMRNHVPSNGDVFTTIAHAVGVQKNFGPSPSTRGPISDLLV
jgi:hypothetical protein